MKFKVTLIVFVLFNSFVFAQIKGVGTDVIFAKEYSKDIALYNSKDYLFRNVFGSAIEVARFEIIPLAAASSGELTTLLYSCESRQKEGIVLGFYGDYFNENGVVYQGFGFKNFEKERAIEFLNQIQIALNKNADYLKDDKDNNNIFFKFDDIDVLIWSTVQGYYTIRLFWNQFEAVWEKTAFDRSKCNR